RGECRMKIEVTQTHIEEGRRRSRFYGGPDFPSEACPIALALRDAGFESPRVTMTQIITDSLGWSGAIPIPEEAATFVHLFDTERPVKPFTFDLPVSEPTHAN